MRRLLLLTLLLCACRTPPAAKPPPPAPDGLSELGAGRACLAQGDLGGARRHLEAALAQSPSLGLAHVELAEVLLQQGASGPALDGALHAAQRQQPQNPRTWQLTAADAENRGDTLAGIHALRRLLLLQPQDSGIRHRLAGLLAAAGQKDEAVATYRAVLQQDPDATPSRLALATLLEELGQLDAAELELTNLVWQAPENPLFARKLEALLVREGKHAPSVKRGPTMRPLQPSKR